MQTITNNAVPTGECPECLGALPFCDCEGAVRPAVGSAVKLSGPTTDAEMMEMVEAVLDPDCPRVGEGVCEDCGAVSVYPLCDACIARRMPEEVCPECGKVAGEHTLECETARRTHVVHYVEDLVKEQRFSPLPLSEGAPWEAWPTVDPVKVSMADLAVGTFEDGTLAMQAGSDATGVLHERAVRDLGNYVGFPADFVLKLPGELAAPVIQHRITKHAEAKRHDVVAMLEGDRFINLFPGWREVLPYSQTAEQSLQLLLGVYEDVDLEHAHADGNGMHLRFLLPVEERITVKVGDVLRAGVAIWQSYGGSIEVALQTTRLICLNRATTEHREFSWTQRSAGSMEHQARWLKQGIADALGAFDTVVERARVMADTPIDGDPREVLAESARAMQLPKRHLASLLEAYEAEPDATQWGIANAFTRLGTHALPAAGLGRRVLRATGEWTENFELCTARLPRPIAMRAGAQILD